MLDWFNGKRLKTRKHSSRIRTDRAATRPSSEPASLRLIVDRQTRVKTLPSLAVGNEYKTSCSKKRSREVFFVADRCLTHFDSRLSEISKAVKKNTLPNKKCEITSI